MSFFLETVTFIVKWLLYNPLNYIIINYIIQYVVFMSFKLLGKYK